MNNELTAENVPYRQALAINALVRKQLATETDRSGEKLQAVIAFGDVVRTGHDTNVYLLEVIDDWPAFVFIDFSQDVGVSLEGRLLTWAMSPEQFASAVSSSLDNALFSGGSEKDDKTIRAILRDIRRGYVVWYEREKGFVQRHLNPQNSEAQEQSLMDLISVTGTPA